MIRDQGVCAATKCSMSAQYPVPGYGVNKFVLDTGSGTGHRVIGTGAPMAARSGIKACAISMCLLGDGYPATRYLVSSTEHRVTGTEYLVPGTGYRIPGTGYRGDWVPGTGYRVSWYRVPGIYQYHLFANCPRPVARSIYRACLNVVYF